MKAGIICTIIITISLISNHALSKPYCFVDKNGEYVCLNIDPGTPATPIIVTPSTGGGAGGGGCGGSSHCGNNQLGTQWLGEYLQSNPNITNRPKIEQRLKQFNNGETILEFDTSGFAPN
ncbi:MAG: hypothetical protein OEY86_12535 [Nitrospira sp.]|nr:hypothetical protein [Nitrospira sp.]